MSARGINKDTTDYAVKPCVFGGVTDRFKGLYPVNNEVGPGDYNPEDTEAKKVIKQCLVVLIIKGHEIYEGSIPEWKCKIRRE